jgi:2-polyprenyl-3-methyl-5-hydroxy-6-metoxy-1,4-benzoquinol methylase
MGINIPTMQLFCCAKRIGVDFSETMMIGRQIVHAPRNAIDAILGVIGISQERASRILEGQFAEPLFGLLGATHVSSLDVSDFEGATVIHDLNHPLPTSLANRFSVVLEGGTLEHVFNVTQAFKNCMEMVRIGGHFIHVNPANNYMSHGFWQFCPELIYRIFSRENGFQIKAILMHEHVLRGSGASFGQWYKVEDPAVQHSRIELMNVKRTFICTIAQRMEHERIFTRFPQQSHYVQAWKKASQRRPQSPSEFSIRRMIPGPVKRLVGWFGWPGPFDRPYYRRISDEDVMHGRI